MSWENVLGPKQPDLITRTCKTCKTCKTQEHKSYTRGALRGLLIIHKSALTLRPWEDNKKHINRKSRWLKSSRLHDTLVIRVRVRFAHSCVVQQCNGGWDSFKPCILSHLPDGSVCVQSFSWDCLLTDGEALIFSKAVWMLLFTLLVMLNW